MAFPQPAQLLVFILQPHNELSAEVREVLEQNWGPLCHIGEWHPFDKTRYYEGEMGSNLFRSVLSFEKLIDPAKAAHFKLQSIGVENSLRNHDGNRGLNLDIGYMDPDKVVLPSCKSGPWKIYWGEGIWLDIVMHYAKGVFTGSPWSFEDFVRNPYQRDLMMIREKYKRLLKVK